MSLDPPMLARALEADEGSMAGRMSANAMEEIVHALYGPLDARPLWMGACTVHASVVGRLLGELQGNACKRRQSC